MEILTLTAEEVEMVKKARAEKVQELTYNIDINVPICSRLNHAETREWDIKLHTETRGWDIKLKY